MNSAAGQTRTELAERLRLAHAAAGLEGAVEAGPVALTPAIVQAFDALAAFDARQEPGSPRTKLLNVADIFAELPPVPWLCQALDMAPGAPVLLAGYGFSGKTVSAQDLALAVATGTSAWGRFPVRSGRVLHIDYEQGQYLTRQRYQRLAAGRGIDPRSLDGRLVLAPMPGWYLDTDSGDELVRLADGFDLVIVDSFRAACPHTDENSSDARVPLDRLTRISETTGSTFKVLHHARKPSQNATGGARMSVRGSGALFDACGSVLVFGAEKGEPVAVEHEKARISGRPHEAFQLWIEDVEVAGNPTGGLRVSALSSAPPARQSGSERLQDLQGRVLAHIKGEGGITGGNNVLHQHLGGRKETLNAAVSELVRAGRLTRGGTTKEPTLSMTGTT
jgi:AAA domain